MSLPFLPTVKLFVWNVPAISKNTTLSPTNGVGGKLIVAVAVCVFTKNLCPLVAVVKVEPSATTVVQGVPPPRPVQDVPL